MAIIRTKKLKLSPYQRHKKEWKDCRRCSLCQRRRKVVLARGKIPAEVLFIGEAPGVSEDALGRPFCGPAGKLLDHIINLGIDGQADYAITNLVGCIPREEDGNKATEPPEKAIRACDTRLVEFVQLVKPKLIVNVGKLARKWVYGQAQFLAPGQSYWGDPDYLRFCDIIHPAAILRMDVSQKGLAVQRCVVLISDAIDEIL